MEIKWLGTAGFKFSVGDQVFYTDPFLSRNADATPRQPIMPEEIKNADALFLSHGHFDHMMDVPRIVRASNCKVYCSPAAGETLKIRGVKKEKVIPILKEGSLIKFETFKARPFFSRHIKIDAKLILSTVLKMNIKTFDIVRLLHGSPCGQVLSWRFYAENKIIQFFGSAGASRSELKKLADEPIDILLLPLQGHSNICRIGTDIVKALDPKTVIIQHHDNFYPPMSRTVDVQPFLDEIKKNCSTRVIVPQINEPMTV